jgi:hypothetical protein
MHMKKLIFTITFAACFFFLGWAQINVPGQGISYQAAMSDASGNLLSKTRVSLQFIFSAAEDNKEVFYSEVHQCTTDELGLISLVIGEGEQTQGNFTTIPWSSETVWLSVGVDAKGGQQFELLGRTSMQSVPYAYHAATASQLYEDHQSFDLLIEKNQSIYWHTGGNSATQPENHFLGTRDDQDFVWKTSASTRVVFTKNGQLKIVGGVDGTDDEMDAYPILVEGSEQGIWITVNEPRSMSNNFVTFADEVNTWGAIEGQTLFELINSDDYQSQSRLFDLQIVSLTAAGIALAIEAAGFFTAAGESAASIFFAWQVPGWITAGVGVLAQAAGFASDLAQLRIESDNWVEEKIIGVGVSYSSGAGDYAEWLERGMNVRDMYPGEIVGVVGGKLSLNTANADHVMVVSTQPIVLGNAPQEKARSGFEKIAFMGQVPVKVAGKVEIGDYILPSGNFDGLGMAVNPNEMKISDFSKIVGVAWEAANDESMLHYVNVAVGLKNNALATKVDEISNKVDNIIAYLEGHGALHPEGNTKYTNNSSNLAPGSTTATKQFTDAEFDQMVDLNEPLLKRIYAKAKAQLIAQGYDLSAHSELNEFLDDPVPIIKKFSLIRSWFINLSRRSDKPVLVNADQH